MTNSILTSEQITYLCDLAIDAGSVILPFFKEGIASKDISCKADNTLVTTADLKSNEVILQGLKALNLDYPIVSEEGSDDKARKTNGDRFWLVDPLDGTRGFVNGSKDFTVNIALIEHGYPVVGIILHPASGDCYWAMRAAGAFYSKAGEDYVRMNSMDHTRSKPPWLLLTGAFGHSDRLLDIFADLGSVKQVKRNSSIKFCDLAQGKADMYVRLRGIGAWDTAAGQCILEQAGGALIDFTGARLCYNVNPPSSGPAFLALSNPTMTQMYLDCLAKEI